MYGDELWDRVIGMEIGDRRADGDFETGNVYGGRGLLVVDLLHISIGVS